MVESSDYSEVTDGQGRASDMAGPECGSRENFMTILEKVPNVSSSERSPANTAFGLEQDGIDVGKSKPTPSTSSNFTSSYSLRNRKRSKLVYDAKYHPVDDIIRPIQAAKRRGAHEGEQVCLDTDDSSEASTIHTDAEESDNEQSEAENVPKQPTRGKKRRPAQSLAVTEPTRRSPRKISDLKVSYDMSVHPQDEYLVLSSDEEELKCKKKAGTSRHEQTVYKPSLANRVGASKAVKRKHAGYVENSTSDELDSDDEHTFSSVEVDADASTATEISPSSAVAGNPQDSIQYEDVTDVDSLSSGETCVHDDEAAWPAQLGQPFHIHVENLSDQLASEAHAFSPLDYNDDDKENATGNNEMDSDPLPFYEGFSVIPEAEYTETSEERELSSHRALVSAALYDEAAPQTYGLDGTHYNDQVETGEFSFDAMKILVSGAHLPM